MIFKGQLSFNYHVLHWKEFSSLRFIIFKVRVINGSLQLIPAFIPQNFRAQYIKLLVYLKGIQPFILNHVINLGDIIFPFS